MAVTQPGMGIARPETARTLRAIRMFHTLVWAFFAGAILAIPVATWHNEFGWVLGLVGVVSVELAILAFNQLRCPLTTIAARYTGDRRANFDIYLPLWLATCNKQVFGALFLAGSMFAAIRWISRG